MSLVANASQKISPSAQQILLLARTYAPPALAAALRLVPRVAKLLAFLLVLINVRGLPFGWHFKVFWPVAKLRLFAWVARVRTLSLSSRTREAAALAYLDGLSPTGENPLDKVNVVKAWAGPEDCDYNWHLSNSSYPKILDSARMTGALATYPYYARAGGWIALAATHFQFLREIPILAHYEVRSQIVGWDRKWLYIVHRYVTHRKPKPSPKSVNAAKPAASEGASSSSAAPVPSIHTPGTPLTGMTPSPSSTNLAARAEAAVAAAAGAEPDGATLHCVSVNAMVFKFGRITVPPALVLAAEGLGATPAQGRAARERALALGLRGMREMYKGGWRAVPEGDRWWDDAMLGLDARVQARLGKVMGVREGLEGALEVRGL
ncbi:hypothetical protein BC834DRAFT_156740 [Gloeopeniophorella convolvens]|nr:hypothetical protein BC834DRAFT_156740 [Gloeopeniophorella convolvens]